MIKIFIILIIIILIIRFRHVRIKWKTFIKKGFAPKRGKFGVYCYCGKQGKGKTYSLVEFILSEKNYCVCSNIGTIQDFDYFYFSGLNELLLLRKALDYNFKDLEDLYLYINSLGFNLERSLKLANLIVDLYVNNKYLIITYDEIFTALTKTSKINTDVLDFLSQMRKRHIIFLTTAQEWLEINITLRRYCRYQIECNMINFLGLGILFKHFYDAELMKWSNDDNEYIAPLIETSVSKCNVSIANRYDTFERIKS